MKQAKYMIRFDFRNPYGEWVPDYISNNDKGFTREQAEYIVQDMRKRDNIINARMIAMNGRSYDYER